MPDIIDVIIPIHNAFEELVRCVESVRRHTSHYRLMLIDDASTDTRMAPFLDALEREGGPSLIVLRNPQNLGFVKTANRGMALGRNDVVLLNSDTEVTPGWLDKIRRCAASDPRIGTITPFSNNAEIASFPGFCYANPVPGDPLLVNRAIEEAAVPLYPDLPTGVGFCMFIRRRLLDEAGLFDEEAFGAGYGEENDLCLRAAEKGYRNVLCDDTFIVHVGERSFQGDKGALGAKHMARLLARHPHYMEQVQAFIAQDPLAPIRRRALSRLRQIQGKRPGVLHILRGHRAGVDRHGGTDRHVLDLVRATRHAWRHYLLFPQGDTWRLEDWAGDPPLAYRFERLPHEPWGDYLKGVCGAFDIERCHVHTLIGCREGLLTALREAGIPYGYSVHDFFVCCPTIHLMDAEDRYCGLPTDEKTCRLCLASHPLFKGIDIQHWRREHRAFLERADFIIAPSRWASSALRRCFPGLSPQVIPHGFTPSPTTPAPLPPFDLPGEGYLHVGVLGAIGPVKGSRHLETLVERTRSLGLPLRWVVIGYTDRWPGPYQSEDKVLTVHGPYRPEELPALLDHYRIALTAFPSQGPETFCFTLTESWAAGRPALVPPIGALGERMEAAQAGWIMEDWQDMDRILEQLVALSPEDIASRARRAKDVEMGVTSSASALDGVYRGVNSPGSPPSRFSPLRLHEAACRALDMEVDARPSPTSLIHRIRPRVVRWRYTLVGRWIERRLSPRMRMRLKRLFGVQPP